MKKFAFTMAELTICIIALIILCAASTTITKSLNVNKSKIYIYAALRNLTLGNIAISEMPTNDDTFYPDTAQTYDSDSTKTDDWYCIFLSDSLSLAANPNCSKTALSTDVNLIFPNGTTFRGISSSWEEAYEGLYYKNILIDADGEEGMNKLGVDQYPFRIFRGKNHADMTLDGIIYPVECGNDKMYYMKDGSLLVTSMISSYCNGKNNRIASDNTVVSYSIYKVTDGEKPDKATIVASKLSAIEADCKAYGGKGFYHGAICRDYGFKLLEKCAHETTCEDCATYGVCPNGGDKASCDTLANNNKINAKQEDGTYASQGFQCFTLLNKPSSGMGMVGSTIFGNMDI